MVSFINTLLFFIEFAGNIYISLVLLRFLLQVVRADFYNPISQFIVKVTHPLLKPLRKVIPSIGRQDTSSLVLAYLLEFLLIIINLAIIYLFFKLKPITSLLTLFLIALIKLIELVFYLFYLLLIGAAILSWLAPDSNSAPARLIKHSTSSLLAPLRRFIPPIGIIDITPVIALILLLLIKSVVIGTISYFSGVEAGLLFISGG